jgi:hypothetical protein
VDGMQEWADRDSWKLVQIHKCGNKVRGEKNNFDDKLAHKCSWPNLKYYSDICLEGLWYAIKILRITSVWTGI